MSLKAHEQVVRVKNLYNKYDIGFDETGSMQHPQLKGKGGGGQFLGGRVVTQNFAHVNGYRGNEWHEPGRMRHANDWSGGQPMWNGCNGCPNPCPNPWDPCEKNEVMSPPFMAPPLWRGIQNYPGHGYRIRGIPSSVPVGRLSESSWVDSMLENENVWNDNGRNAQHWRGDINSTYGRPDGRRNGAAYYSRRDYGKYNGWMQGAPHDPHSREDIEKRYGAHYTPWNDENRNVEEDYRHSMNFGASLSPPPYSPHSIPLPHHSTMYHGLEDRRLAEKELAQHVPPPTHQQPESVSLFAMLSGIPNSPPLEEQQCIPPHVPNVHHATVDLPVRRKRKVRIEDKRPEEPAGPASGVEEKRVDEPRAPARCAAKVDDKHVEEPRNLYTSCAAQVEDQVVDARTFYTGGTTLEDKCVEDQRKNGSVAIKTEEKRLDEPRAYDGEMPKPWSSRALEENISPDCETVSSRQDAGSLERSESDTHPSISPTPDNEAKRQPKEIQQSNPQIPAEAGHEDSEDEWLGDQEAWTEYAVNPLAVRFSQDSIHPFFYRRGPVTSVLGKIMHAPPQESQNRSHQTERLLLPPFAPIRILSSTPPDSHKENDAEMWALDNRRLYALQLAAVQRWPARCLTKVLVTDHLPRKKFKTNYRKFKTQTKGRSVHVVAKFQHFDEWDWFTAAMEKEFAGIRHHVGCVLQFFQFLPMFCIFFVYIQKSEADHDKMVRGVMFVVMALAFALDYIRKRMPQLDMYVAERQVRALLDGDSIRAPNWVPLFPVHRQGTVPYLCYMLLFVLLGLLPYIFICIDYARVRSIAISVWIGLGLIMIKSLVVAKGRLTDPEVTRFPHIKNSTEDEYAHADDDYGMFDHDSGTLMKKARSEPLTGHGASLKRTASRAHAPAECGSDFTMVQSA